MSDQSRRKGAESAPQSKVQAHHAGRHEASAESKRQTKKGGGRKQRAATLKKRRSIAMLAFCVIVFALFSIGAYRLLRLRSCAAALKDDAKELMSAVRAGDADRTEGTLLLMQEHVEKLQRNMDTPLWMIMRQMPGLQQKTASVEALAELVQDANTNLLQPYVPLMRDYPLTALKTGNGGINAAMLCAYIDFVQAHMPQLREMQQRLAAVDFDALGEIEKLNERLALAGELLDTAISAEPYFPLAKAFLGDGEDRLYVFAAQNTAEIRASGGFPGSVGTIRIKDGVLQLNDFMPVNAVLAFHGSDRAQISSVENTLFAGWLNEPRDADYCPDFERVAEIWAIAYQDKNGEPVDGVLSATPVIIQKLLAILGEIELSDGTVLNGDNATKALEYDLYYRYFGAGSDYALANEITNALFAETAGKTMSLLLQLKDPQKLDALLQTAKDCAAERTLMLWFVNEQEQALVRELGLDSGLNREPDKPEAGIYFSLSNPGRMGWFLDMDAEKQLIETRADGSRVYEITLRMANVITTEELDAASPYISGVQIRGCVGGFLHLFAPAGGTISDIECSNQELRFERQNYHDLDLQYNLRIRLFQDDVMSLRYTVTTAPGEQEELSFSMTPTLQEYRETS